MFYKYTDAAVKNIIRKMQVLLCYFIWFSSAFEIRNVAYMDFCHKYVNDFTTSKH